MTKLMEWLGALIGFLAVYLYLLTGEPKVSEEMMLHIKFLPIYLIGMFGGYSVYTVLYRVFTFNDCPEAAEEIQKQIEEAKVDLSAKGMHF
ncbi:dolichol-phosphate mannosyltransferase subunit 3 [Sitodiplosis mosellana]|uniref:dolichol-phosphate mannosyltransferase subunit 3 n=1 Tax=Sitodiplosis mosellana TaxID=263140 RepID=UPI0024440126|nr:dolichol-phosphate mannosyltransferase subunit 3 [Sitodiplosis mosellana]